jgi:hypothetical protein
MHIAKRPFIVQPGNGAGLLGQSVSSAALDIGGRGLVIMLRGKTALQRACVGVDWVKGHFRLEDPTHRQAAAAVDVSLSTFNSVLALTEDERRRVALGGDLPPSTSALVRTLKRAGTDRAFNTLCGIL